MSLYQKYRPKTLDQVKGNKEIISTLDSMLNDIKTCPHSFLITGPTGCGKTTIGRIIADRLDCKGQDFREIDSADFRGIDSIRSIRKDSQFKPVEGNTRVWLIDECHKMTNDAQNALLKILEDTPPHVYFILCTTEPQKLIDTIKGRCSSFQVQTLNDNEMIQLLREVVKSEEKTLVRAVYKQIVNDSLGHCRNALQILDQVLRVDAEQQLCIASKAAEEQSKTIELCRALVGKKGWKEIKGILQGLKGEDPENIRRSVLGYCSAVLLKKDEQHIGLIMEEFAGNFWNSGFPGLVLACYTIVKS